MTRAIAAFVQVLAAALMALWARLFEPSEGTQEVIDVLYEMGMVS